jgi:hypothetical protein
MQCDLHLQTAFRHKEADGSGGQHIMLADNHARLDPLLRGHSGPPSYVNVNLGPRGVFA